MPDVKIAGTWAESLGHVGAVSWTTAWGAGVPAGATLASYTLAVGQAVDTVGLRLAQTSEVFRGDKVKAFGGVLSELGRGFPREISARGWMSRAADFDAVDEDGNPTTNPREAVTQAIARGLPWTNPEAFDDTPLGDAPTTPARLNTLLNQWGVTVSKTWGVDPEGVAFVASNPTTPSLFLDASDLDLGVADDGLFTRVRARRVTAVDVDNNPTAWQSVTVDDEAGQREFGALEYPMDLTPLGTITEATATAYAQAQLDLLTVPQWLSRVTTNSSRLFTPAGHPVQLDTVHAGQMVRLFNVPNSLGGLRGELGLDVVLGESSYSKANPREVTIAPVGLAVRNLADAFAQAARAAARTDGWAA